MRTRDSALIGRTVSHYKIIEDLGFAGEDAVYKAEDTRTHETVALKFLRRATPAPGEEYDLDQFRHEAMAASALNHPNIGSIYEIEETPDLGTFISMPIYEGETLRDRIDQGPLHIQETVEISHEIAAGLSCAHEHGIVHRSLTPSNIVIQRNGLVKILDFGLYAHPRRRKLTRAASQTVAYMSPEQLRDDIANQRADIWALGVMMYQMLAGRPPFVHQVEAGLMYLILSEEPAPLLELRPDCPPHLADIIQRCLRKNPEDRFQSLDEFIQQLKILSEKPSAAANILSVATNRY
jgi:serine/threonine protein kinase